MTAALEGDANALLANMLEAHRTPESQPTGKINVDRSGEQGHVSIVIQNANGARGGTVHIEGTRVALRDGRKVDAAVCTTGKNFTPLPTPPALSSPQPVQQETAAEEEPKRLLTKEHFTYRYRDEESGLIKEALDPAYDDYINRRSPLRTTYDGERVTWSVPCSENGRCGVRAGFSSRPPIARSAPMTYGQWLAQAALEAEEKERRRLKKERKKREAAEKKQRKKEERARKRQEKKERAAARKAELKRRAEEEKRRKEQEEIQRRLNKCEPTEGQQLFDSIRSFFWSKEHKARKFAYKNRNDDPPDDPPGALGVPLAIGHGDELERDGLVLDEELLDELDDEEDDLLEEDSDEEEPERESPWEGDPSFENLAYLNTLAQRYAKRAALMAAGGCDAYADRLTARAADLADFVLHEPDRREIKLNEPFPSYVYDEFEGAHDFEQFHGNGARHRLHTELRENIELAADTARELRDNEFVQSQLPAVIAFSELAREQSNPEAAFSLADTAFHLARAAKELGRSLMDSGNVVGYVAGACLSGGVKVVERTAESFNEFVHHPIDSSVRSAVALGKLAYAGMKAAHTIIAGNSAEKQELWEQACAAGILLRDNPDELAAFMFSFYLPHPPTALSAPSYARKIKKLSDALERQDYAFAELFHQISGRFKIFAQPQSDLVTPEGVVLHELAKTTKPVSMMMKKMAKQSENGAGKNARDSNNGKRGKQIKENSLSAVVKAVGPHGHCHSSGKHHINSMGNISPAAKNGQKALDQSISNPISENSTGRIGLSEGEIVFLRFTGIETINEKRVPVYHSHVLLWDSMKDELKTALIDLKWVDKKGRVLIHD